MQIHISWKTLLAALIFILSTVLIVRVSIGLLSPPRTAALTPVPSATQSAALTPEAAGAADTGPAATPSSAASSTVTAARVTQEAPSSTATASPEPATATATLEPTLPPLTPTLAPPPTRAPTPRPVALRVVDQGFGQTAGRMSYAFVVNNPNPDLLAQSVRYQVAVYDPAGVVIATDNDIIMAIGPGQELGVAKDLSIAGELAVARIEILLRPGQFVRSPPLQTLSVTNGAIIGSGQPSVTGIVSNTFNRDLIEVKVIGIIYDDTGIIGGGSSVLPFVPAQGQAAVSIPVVTGQSATRVAFWVELFAEPETP